MKDYDFKDLFSLVRDGGVLTFRSIFDFTGGISDIFAFLGYCRKKNCTVIFNNESVRVEPDSDTNMNIILMLYAHVAEQPKLALDYVRYLGEIKLSKTKCKPTLILTER